MKALKHLNKYFIKYKWRLIAGIVITFLSKLLTLQIPKIVKNSLNSVQDYHSGLLPNVNDVKSDLFVNISLIIGATILAGFLTFLMRQTIIVTSRLIEFDLKNEIYAQYQRLSVNFYKKNRTGDLMNRISEDVSKVRMYAGPSIMYSLNILVSFVIGFTHMISISPKLTLYTMLPFPLLSISIFILSKEINKRSRITQEYLSKLTTYNQEFFSGINVVKSYAIEKSVIKDFENLANDAKEKNLELSKAQALFFPLMILLIGLSNIIVVYFGGKQYINGEIEIGVIGAFVMYVNILTWPVASIGWVASIIQQADSSQERINIFLKEIPEITNLNNKELEIKGKIEFSGVHLTYDDTNIKALKNVSFTLEQGKTLGIMGKTGSGKSSIVNLVSRLYDTSQGLVSIDGINIKNHNLSQLRKLTAVVPQDPFLFSDTIANNIKFGKANATESELMEAAKKAVVHDNIMKFNNKYETILGERGVTLSGGQKQRTAIARALIKEPKILIFDDCLSAVDTETEEKILTSLEKFSKNKTTIIVSHRVSSVKNADKIIVLDKGEIIQKGTHDELIKINGYYKELYKKQLVEKEN